MLTISSTSAWSFPTTPLPCSTSFSLFLSTPLFPKSPKEIANSLVSSGSVIQFFQFQLLVSSKTTSLLTTTLRFTGSSSLYAFDPGSVPRCTNMRDLSSSFLRCERSIFAYAMHPNIRTCSMFGRLFFKSSYGVTLITRLATLLIRYVACLTASPHR